MSRINEDRAKLMRLLAELDLDPAEQGANGIKILLDGIYATMMVYGDGTLSLACSVRGNGPKWDLERINTANNRIRFAKFSVDHEKLLLEADFVLNISSRDLEDQLSQVLELWRMALRELLFLVEQFVAA